MPAKRSVGDKWHVAVNGMAKSRVSATAYRKKLQEVKGLKSHLDEIAAQVEDFFNVVCSHRLTFCRVAKKHLSTLDSTDPTLIAYKQRLSKEKRANKPKGQRLNQQMPELPPIEEESQLPDEQSDDDCVKNVEELAKESDAVPVQPDAEQLVLSDKLAELHLEEGALKELGELETDLVLFEDTSDITTYNYKLDMESEDSVRMRKWEKEQSEELALLHEMKQKLLQLRKGKQSTPKYRQLKQEKNQQGSKTLTVKMAEELALQQQAKANNQLPQMAKSVQQLTPKKSAQQSQELQQQQQQHAQAKKKVPNLAQLAQEQLSWPTAAEPVQQLTSEKLAQQEKLNTISKESHELVPTSKQQLKPHLCTEQKQEESTNQQTLKPQVAVPHPNPCQTELKATPKRQQKMSAKQKAAQNPKADESAALAGQV